MTDLSPVLGATPLPDGQGRWCVNPCQVVEHLEPGPVFTRPGADAAVQIVAMIAESVSREGRNASSGSRASGVSVMFCMST